MTTKMFRKTVCSGCGYTQMATLSYYLDRKLWKANHTKAVCSDRQSKMTNHIQTALVSVSVPSAMLEMLKG